MTQHFYSIKSSALSLQIIHHWNRATRIMPTYTLHYFNGRGRAELCRLLFVTAGQKFEDKRYDQTTWPAFKPKTPMGQLPCLTIDGAMYGQSKPMANYLANEFGLHGKNNLEQLKINIVVETVSDLAETMAKIRYEKDESKKAEIIKKVKEETMPMTLKWLEGKLSAEYFNGSSLTIADLMVFNILEQVLKNEPNVLNDFPKLKALVKKVGSNPKIAEYIKQRPETPF